MGEGAFRAARPLGMGRGIARVVKTRNKDAGGPKGPLPSPHNPRPYGPLKGFSRVDADGIPTRGVATGF